MSDDDLKRAVLDAALERAASEAFSDTLLAKAAAEAGAANDVARLFPRGVSSLLEFYSHEADAEMVRALDALHLAQMPMRARIRTAVLTRLDVLKPHKEAARRAALQLAPDAPLAARLVYDTVDKMWRAAGDTSTDFAFYTKRASLTAVYTATLMRWFADSSVDAHETTSFLDARIENVMTFEKLKADVRKNAKAGMDCLADLLRR